jgi:hypothetical protein
MLGGSLRGAGDPLGRHRRICSWRVSRHSNRAHATEIAMSIWTTWTGIVQTKLRTPASAGHPSQSSVGRDTCCCRVRVKVAISGPMLRRMLRRPDLGCESLPGVGWLVANNSVPRCTMSTRLVALLAAQDRGQRMPERAARPQPPPPAGGANAGPAMGRVRHDLLLACRIHRRRRGRRPVRLTGSRHVARPRGDSDGPLGPPQRRPGGAWFGRRQWLRYSSWRRIQIWAPSASSRPFGTRSRIG